VWDAWSRSGAYPHLGDLPRNRVKRASRPAGPPPIITVTAPHSDTPDPKWEVYFSPPTSALPSCDFLSICFPLRIRDFLRRFGPPSPSPPTLKDSSVWIHRKFLCLDYLVRAAGPGLLHASLSLSLNYEDASCTTWQPECARFSFFFLSSD